MPPQTIPAPCDGRLDHILKQLFPHLSNSALRQWFKQHQIKVNGKLARPGSIIKKNDLLLFDDGLQKLHLSFPPDPNTPLQILHLDDHLIAIDKPSGLVTHPIFPWETTSATQALVAIHPEIAGIGEPRAPGLLHRLDNETSGVLLFARTQDAFDTLSLFRQRGRWKKEYLAWLHGALTQHLECTQDIGHHPKNKKKMILSKPSQLIRGTPQPAHSIVTPLLHQGNFTLAQIQITTGVRHQIRLHLASAGYPLLGDLLYGPPTSLFHRLMLHSWRLSVPHPSTNKTILLEAKNPFPTLPTSTPLNTP